MAALYVVLTYVSSTLGLSGGVIQLRISEVLCVLPAYTPSAVPGLFVGCMIANLLTGAGAFDIVFGSIATLLGAVGSYCVGKKNKMLALIPPILSNAVIIPFVLRYAYGAEDALWFMFLTVGMGEVLSCGVGGAVMLGVYNRIFKNYK